MSPVKISQGGASFNPDRPPGRPADSEGRSEKWQHNRADHLPAASEFRSLNPGGRYDRLLEESD